MDTTIRNLDLQLYRELKAKAALAGQGVGEALNSAIRAWLSGPSPFSRDRSLKELSPQPWGARNRRASEQIDDVVYGVKS
ncbi:MAG: hypothetical protein M3041_17670 [Acidobacteriota bacterium]|nr:hypothetical protein [Acidobacteriota bacterium]